MIKYAIFKRARLSETTASVFGRVHASLYWMFSPAFVPLRMGPRARAAYITVISDQLISRPACRDLLGS